MCISLSLSLSLLCPGVLRLHWEESRVLLGGGLRILSTSGGPTGTRPRKAACPKERCAKRSQPHNSQETDPSVFEIPLSKASSHNLNSQNLILRSQIPEPLLIFTSKCHLKASDPPGAGSIFPYYHIELLKTGRARSRSSGGGPCSGPPAPSCSPGRWQPLSSPFGSQ